MKGEYYLRVSKNNCFSAGRGVKRKTASCSCRGDPLEQEINKELILLSIKEELRKAGLIRARKKDNNQN